MKAAGKNIFSNKYAALLTNLSLLFLFTLSSCSGKNQALQDRSLVKAENNAAYFSSFSNELFKKELPSSTLNLNYTLASPQAFSIKKADSAFGSTGESARQESIQEMKTYKHLLEKLDTRLFDRENHITFDTLYWYFENECSSSAYSYYHEPLSPCIGIQAQLPVLLAEYSFRCEQDITDYLFLLSSVDSYFDELISYEKEKAKAGLFMPDYAVEDIVLQCRRFLGEGDAVGSPSSHFLFSSFDRRMDACSFLNENQKQDYKEQNRLAVSTGIFPAYHHLIEELSSQKGLGKNEQGLSYFPKGQEYYAYLVKAQTGSDKTIHMLHTLVADTLESDLAAMTDLLNSNPKLLTQLKDIRLDNLTPKQTIEALKEASLADFPPAPEVSCTVKFVDSSLEQSLSPAFYLTPPIDNISENVIYINRLSCPEGLSRYSTLAHEGYPGHLYQNIYTNAKNQPSIRSLLSFPGFSEGYATYAEHLSYNYLDINRSIADILRLSSQVTLSLYATLDLGIHDKGWSLSDASLFLRKYGIREEAVVQKIYRAIVEEPANYLKYYIGYLEILELKEKAESRLGDDFSLKWFHDRLLSIGDAPFCVIEKYLFRE